MKKLRFFLCFVLLAPALLQAQTDSEKEIIRKYRTGGLNFINGPDSAILNNGDITPAFTMADTAGKAARLGAFKGKYIMIDVWASWCKWCIQEYPYIDKLKKDFAGKKIEFVSLSCDDDVPRWKGAIAAYHLQSDNNWIITDKSFMKAFGIAGIPRFILLGKEGEVLNADMTKPSKNSTKKYLSGLKGL